MNLLRSVLPCPPSALPGLGLFSTPKCSHYSHFYRGEGERGSHPGASNPFFLNLVTPCGGPPPYITDYNYYNTHIQLPLEIYVSGAK